tara:strand:+ start:325 stop:462 length:138 start_codon:yes stop_codon:yes gene_type:complete
MKQESNLKRGISKINEGYEKAVEDGGENIIRLEKTTRNLEARKNT